MIGGDTPVSVPFRGFRGLQGDEPFAGERNVRRGFSPLPGF